MHSQNSTIVYRGWSIEPFAIPCADGSWQGTCEIRKMDGAPDDSGSAELGNVVRATKEDAVSEICEQARHVIDSSCAFPDQTNAAS